MTIFEKIITGEIPAYKIAEDDNYLAFLDVFPLKRGHTLVIPKMPVDYIFNLEDEVLAGLNIFAKRVAKAVEAAVPCERIGVAVIGLEVPHTHIHLIPINNVSDLNFANPKLKFTEAEMEETAAAIKQLLV
jgi:histidine triad (HIT) family protein